MWEKRQDQETLSCVSWLVPLPAGTILVSACVAWQTSTGAVHIRTDMPVRHSLEAYVYLDMKVAQSACFCCSRARPRGSEFVPYAHTAAAVHAGSCKGYPKAMSHAAVVWLRHTQMGHCECLKSSVPAWQASLHLILSSGQRYLWMLSQAQQQRPHNLPTFHAGANAWRSAAISSKCTLVDPHPAAARTGVCGVPCSTTRDCGSPEPALAWWWTPGGGCAGPGRGTPTWPGQTG